MQIHTNILAIDVGTTILKMGIFNSSLTLEHFYEHSYNQNIVCGEKAEIDPDIWWMSIIDGCRSLGEHLKKVGILTFSVTTPGLVAMDEQGNALIKAILFLDQRSHKQAEHIISTIGKDLLLERACNLPVSGGSSLSSILWVKENLPEIYSKTYKFGHTNTYLINKLTKKWAIDPSTTSVTGLYNTRMNDMTWNSDFLHKLAISEDKLPELYQSYDEVGNIESRTAQLLGLPESCIVLCGGNDAVLSALSAGINSPGDILHITGTCDILMVCLANHHGSQSYNIRSHILPDLFLTLFVLNTGGKSLEWFHSVFCREMSDEEFYSDYVPEVLERKLGQEPPDYVPFLNGSRYSTRLLKAGFSGVDTNSTRDDFLMAILKGNNLYMASHLKEISEIIKLNRTIKLTGGVMNIRNMLNVKRKWLGDYDYEYIDQSSLMGAAKLGKLYFDNLKKYKNGNSITKGDAY